MQWNDFKELDIQKQIEFFNKEFKAGTSKTDMGKKLGTSRNSINRLLKKIGYKQLKRESKELNKDTRAVTSIEPKEQKAIDNVVEMGWGDINSFMKRLVAVESDLKAVREDLKAVRSKCTHDTKKALTIDSEAIETHILEPKMFESDLKQISYRYNTEILDKLDQLCKQYPHYSKTSILNTLLNESIEKYLK